jgi:preprotein translocase subunit SecG
MAFIIYLFTAVLILDCAVLVLLILMQLPKKEAGAGLAFGSGATDALFGAGSGNFLTKATKWSAGILFGLAIFLSVMQSKYSRHEGTRFHQLLQEAQARQAAAVPAPNDLGVPPAVTASTNAPLGENPAPAPVTAPAPAPVTTPTAASNAAPAMPK